MSELETLKLFATAEHACSYLEDERATTVFVDPDAQLDKTMYSQLSDYGFRRSGKHIYKPRCTSCQACVPIRLPVNAFTPTKSQRRCFNRNKDLTISVSTQINKAEYFPLYAAYIDSRHHDGDMHPAKSDEFLSFLSPQMGSTCYLELRNTKNELLAVAVTDKLDQGISAIYTFFDPHQDKRSLGVYAILAQIEWAKSHQYDYVYLGYWIKKCQKMSYKTKYSPFQLLINNQWMTLG